MAPAEPHILCTAAVSDTIVRRAGAQGIRITVQPFIRNEHITTPGLRDMIERIAHAEAQVIFTSSHAVEGVHALLPSGCVPQWTVHAVGGRTREQVRTLVGDARVRNTAAYAEELAQAIADDGTIRRVVFFCGDQRLDTLPARLTAAGITVEEVQVYRTIATPQRITSTPDGVLFMSPSAVESFFSLNTLSKHTIPFAIGRTTATALSGHTQQPVIIPPVPTREALLASTCDHFATIRSRPCP